jgi:hypothetical protein
MPKATCSYKVVFQWIFETFFFGHSLAVKKLNRESSSEEERKGLFIEE